MQKILPTSLSLAQAFLDLHNHGKTVSARGLLCKELEDYSFYIDQPFADFPSRELSMQYIFSEFKWYLQGDRNSRYIEKASNVWQTLRNLEKPYYNSNYGYYFYTEGQFQYVIDILSIDKDSRQATIVLNRPNVMMSDSKDKVCTNAIGFRIRDNKLNMSVSMRSNDLIYGTCIDAPQFWFLRSMILAKLKLVYPELELGTYYHKADSFHVYERHFEMLENIVNNKESIIGYTLPTITSEDVDYLLESKLEYAPLQELGFSNLAYNLSL